MTIIVPIVLIVLVVPIVLIVAIVLIVLIVLVVLIVLIVPSVLVVPIVLIVLVVLIVPIVPIVLTEKITMSYSNPLHHSSNPFYSSFIHQEYKTMSHQPMSSQDYWWNHLTPEQQQYIIDYYTDRYPAMLHHSVIASAFIEQCYEGWSKKPNWPQYIPRII